MSAPRITSAELSNFVALSGSTISCVVEWIGEPRVTPTFQWRNGTITLRGAVASQYTPAANMPELNCVVRVDNGRGQAVAVATLEPSTPVDPEDPDDPEIPVESIYVVSGYVVEGYVV